MARSLAVQLQFVEIKEPKDLDSAFSQMTIKGELAPSLSAGGALLALISEYGVAELAARSRLPAIHFDRS